MKAESHYKMHVPNAIEHISYHWFHLVVVWLQHKILILNYSINKQLAITHLLKEPRFSELELKHKRIEMFGAKQKDRCTTIETKAYFDIVSSLGNNSLDEHIT